MNVKKRKTWLYATLSSVIAVLLAAHVTWHGSRVEDKSAADGEGAAASAQQQTNVNSSAAAASQEDMTSSISAEESAKLDEASRKVEAAMKALARQEEENIARRMKEVAEIAPRTTTMPHHAVKVTDTDLANAPQVTGIEYYKNLDSELLVYDYRETIKIPELSDEDSPAEQVTREWLLSEGEECYVVRVAEYADRYADGSEVIADTEEYVADVLVARVGPEHTLADFRKAIEAEGLGFGEVLLTNPKGQSMVVVTAPEATLDAYENARAKLAALGICSVIEPSQCAHLSKVPNDKFYSNYQAKDWSVINAPKAWDTRTDSSSVIVAVTDTGVYGLHTDLKNNMWVDSSVSTQYNWGAWIYNGKVTQGTSDLLDLNGHGTHCAGIIGAVGNDSTGVAGISWKAKVMGIKFVYGSSGSASTNDMCKAWIWAADHGAKVINCSFGGSGAVSTLEKESAAYLKNKDVILVCAAGNDGTNNDSKSHSPANLAASYDNVISVAATNQNNALASFSNYGANNVKIAAPGYAIMSTYVWIEDSKLNFGWAQANGTSMAAPMVTGAVTMLRSQYPSKTYSSIIQDHLYAKASTPSYLSGKVEGGRFLNLGAAMEAPVTVTPTASQGTYEDKIVLSWSAVTGRTHYRVYYSTSATGTKTALGSGWQTATSFTHLKSAGLEEDKNYYYWVKSATSSSGANASDFGSMATGWLKKASLKYPDQWDPNDNSMSGATLLSVTTSKQTTSKHGVMVDGAVDGYEEDYYDYYKFTVTAANVGKLMTFASTIEGGSVYATKDLRGMICDADGNELAYNDDVDGDADNYDFRVAFSPTKAGTYYLLVCPWNQGEGIINYTLSYQIGGEPVYTELSLDMEADGGVCSLGTNSDNLTIPWQFQITSKPAWVTRITLKMPDGSSKDLTNLTSYTTTFEGEGSVEFAIAKNQTTAERSWDKFIVITNTYYRTTITQEAGTSLQPPATVTASQGTYDAKVAVSWSAVSGAGYYRVARATSADGELKPVSSWMSGATSFFDTASSLVPLVADQEYWYAVQAASTLNGSDASAYSARVTGWAGSLDTKYTLKVENGSGSGSYPEGASVDIKAANAPVGQEFLKWTGDTSAVADVNSAQTKVTMPSHNVAIKATYTATSAVTSPFEGDVVRYPNNPLMLVYTIVTINGHYPSSNDWIAAYCGSEKRAEAQLDALDSNHGIWLKVNWSKTGETIKFRIYDAASKQVYDAVTTIASSTTSTYTKNNPLLLEVGANDPYGEPVKYPNNPVLVGVFEASVYDEPINTGDIVTVFCGSELRAKATMTAGQQRVTLKISRAKMEGETLTFKIYDIDAKDEEDESVGKQFDALISVDGGEPSETYVTKSSVSVIGSASKPAELTVSSTKTLKLELPSGWKAFALNVTPEEAALEDFWANSTSKLANVQMLQQDDKIYMPDVMDEIGSMEAAMQYWVNLSKADTVTVTGEELNERDYTFTLNGDRVSSLPYILQENSELKSTFKDILSNADYTVEKITGSGGGVFTPGAPDSQNTLTVLKPGEVYWVFPKTGSKTITFKYPMVSTSSLAKSLSYMASTETLPTHWQVPTWGGETSSQESYEFRVSLDYFGETIPGGNSDLYVAAFTTDAEDNRQLVAVGKYDDGVSFVINPKDFDMETGEAVGTVAFAISKGIETSHEISFEVFDKGQPVGVANGIFNASETYTVAELAEGGRFALSVNGEEKPSYTVTFVLRENELETSKKAELLPGQEESILSQTVERGTPYTGITIPRITTGECQFGGYYVVDSANVTVSKTYYVTFKGLEYHDCDTDKVNSIDFNGLNSILSLYGRSYGRADVEDDAKGWIVMGGTHNGRPHSADLNQDWKIDFVELNDFLAMLYRNYKVNESARSRLNYSQGAYGYDNGFIPLKK